MSLAEAFITQANSMNAALSLQLSIFCLSEE
jgi:hypothetical protein